MKQTTSLLVAVATLAGAVAFIACHNQAKARDLVFTRYAP